MHLRQKITEIFSTFIQFEADRFSHWVTDQRLHQSMQKCLQEQSTRNACASIELSEPFWTLYWHHCWQTRTHAFAEGHLAAYLQEPGYWAAQQMARKLTTVQFGVSDYFQIVMVDVCTVLKGFKPDRGANLKTFASIAFPRLLKDSLRQRQEADLCSNLGLLRRTSKKRLLEALRQAGLAKATLAQYQLAWVCFNALYVTQAGSKQLPAVDCALWSAIAALYNTERRTLAESAVECHPETIERWLNQCATWVRAYLYPPVESLNVPRAGLESSSERQDDLPDSLQESLLTVLVLEEEQQERQAQWLQLRGAIVAALEQMDAQSQELLRLYYQQGRTQQQIMQQLQMSQATVSRRLTKAREALLLALVQWGQEKLNSPATPDRIKEMSAALEEWLMINYSEPNASFGRQTAEQETE